MKKTVVYIHGKGGSSAEAEHYRPLFPDCDVIGFDYTAETPWEAKEEFTSFFSKICSGSRPVILIANSIGAFFAMHSFAGEEFEKAFFISPVADMEKLIESMMLMSGVTEDELMAKKEIRTGFGETLSWEYLCYVRSNSVKWCAPSYILYAENDNLTSFESVSALADKTGSSLTVMKNGEHWFHTEEQMEFLDRWIISNK